MDHEAAEVAELLSDISRFLLSSSLMDQTERHGILKLAFSGEAILQRLDYQGSRLSFVPGLVACLVDYGYISNGKHALWSLLLTMKDSLGIDRKDEIDGLCERIKNTKNFRPSKIELLSSRVAGGQGIGSATLDLPGVTDSTEGSVEFTAVILRQITSIYSSEIRFLVTQSDISFVHSQGIEEGRKIERQALTQSRALGNHQSIEQEALRLQDTIKECMQIYDTTGAFEHARALENHLNGEADSLSSETLTLGFELLANTEILKHKAAGEAGDPMALGRAGQFLKRAKDAAKRS
jgi:Effector-associated domain 8